MKLKYKFELLEMDDQFVAVPVGDNASELKGILKLNKSAVEIIELLSEDVLEEEIVRELGNRYDSSEEEIKVFVTAYIKELEDARLLR